MLKKKKTSYTGDQNSTLMRRKDTIKKRKPSFGGNQWSIKSGAHTNRKCWPRPSNTPFIVTGSKQMNKHYMQRHMNRNYLLGFNFTTELNYGLIVFALRAYPEI